MKIVCGIFSAACFLVICVFTLCKAENRCIKMKNVDWSVFSSSNLTCDWVSKGNISMQLHVYNQTVDLESCAKYCKEQDDDGNECQGFIYNTNTLESDGNNCATCKSDGNATAPSSHKRKKREAETNDSNVSFHSYSCFHLV